MNIYEIITNDGDKNHIFHINALDIQQAMSICRFNVYLITSIKLIGEVK